MEIHHIGYLVKNIKKAAAQFRYLGFEAEGECVYDPSRDIDILFMANGSYRIELVSPKTEKSVVAKLRKKMGNTPYHVCFYSDDIKATCEEMREKGLFPISEIEPAVAIGGKNVCFLVDGAAGMVELLER